jgi:hypothetical protein
MTERDALKSIVWLLVTLEHGAKVPGLVVPPLNMDILSLSVSARHLRQIYKMAMLGLGRDPVAREGDFQNPEEADIDMLPDP